MCFELLAFITNLWYFIYFGSEVIGYNVRIDRRVMQIEKIFNGSC